MRPRAAIARSEQKPKRDQRACGEGSRRHHRHHGLHQPALHARLPGPGGDHGHRGQERRRPRSAHAQPAIVGSGHRDGHRPDRHCRTSDDRQDGDWERRWAGSHNSLGELLGRATRDAVRRCLLLQNGVCAELRRTVCGALGRHGCDEEALRRCARTELPGEAADLFERNLLALIHDPQSAAAAYCLAESIDLAAAGSYTGKSRARPSSIRPHC
jgi:hypothetical protein